MKQELSLFLVEGTAYYFLSINILYGVLLILSWLQIKRFRHNKRKIKNPKPVGGVSFIIPAFNEESLIVETIQTYVSLSNIQKEIIIINDGSSDQTFKLLQTMFQLQKMEDSGSVYRSITQPEMFVIEMPHAGKAEALNQGMKQARYDLVCTMDADTVPTPQGVEACLSAFANDPHLIAAGGIIQILGSQYLRNNSPDGKESSQLVSSFQRLEYFRTFVCERLGWSFLGSTILISGAFCMVKKEAVNKIGGFRPESITEDFDLIVRLRREFNGDKFRFQVLPLSVCHTQVPRALNHLKKQRVRWQMGLVQTLSRHLSLIFHPIERNLGNGNIGAARARRMVAEKEMSFGRQSYKFEVMATRRTLNLKLEQVTQSEIEFTKAKELVTSETYKFKTGGGNLFLVNLREQALANAEASFHEARLVFMNTLLGYQALVSTTNQ